MHRDKIDRILGLSLLLITVILLVGSFWKMGGEVQDALVLHSYITSVARNGERSFGYGGEQDNEKVDVPFQARNMSNVSFVISRDDNDRYWLKGRNDAISTNRTVFPAEEAVELNDGAQFETRGPLGRATFVARLDTNGTIKLVLRAPIYTELRPGMSRLIVGPAHDPSPSNIDEIYFRTPPTQESRVQSYFMRVKDDGLLVESEPDLSLPAALLDKTKVSPSPGASPEPSPAVTAKPAPTPLIIKPGEVLQFGTVGLTFSHNAAAFWPLKWFGRVQIYGLRLALAILLIGFAFSRHPQVKWPSGYTVFGCVTLFMAIGLILSARDYFFFPHHPRFREYLWFSFYSVIFLYALRVPLKKEADATDAMQRLRNLVIALACFFIAYLLINETFDGSALSLWALIKGFALTASLFIISLILSLIIQNAGGKGLASLVQNWDLARFRRWSIIPFLILLVFVLLVRSEALMIGVRLHVPTLLLPFIVLWTAILISAAESNDERREVWSLLAIGFPLLVIAAYGLFSHDTGGSAVLALGMVCALWLGSRKKSVPLFATLVIALLGVLYALQNQPARFDLAWGNDEGRLFFEEAKNLRLARDMARSGSLLGNFLELRIPSEVRSNLHSDLIAAYVIGFFGWLTFLLLLSCFCLFYDRLFNGLYLSFPKKVNETGAVDEHQKERLLLLIVAGAMLLTFAGQAMWVISATLQRLVPLTGLDLQPISTSSISVLSFFVILLGTIALAHSLNHSFQK